MAKEASARTARDAVDRDERSLHPVPPPGMEWVSEFRVALARLVRLRRSYYQRNPPPLPSSRDTVLYALEAFGPATITQLAVLEGVQKPSVTRAIARLEEQGLVRREIDESDRRQSLIHITRDGRIRMEAAHRVADEWYIQQLTRLSAKDVDAIRLAVPAIGLLARQPSQLVAKTKPANGV
jgi:DNA-binding MarR family transcriptional regulator